MKEKERERERDRERERKREKEIERDRERQRETERDRERQGQQLEPKISFAYCQFKRKFKKVILNFEVNNEIYTFSLFKTNYIFSTCSIHVFYKIKAS